MTCGEKVMGGVIPIFRTPHPKGGEEVLKFL